MAVLGAAAVAAAAGIAKALIPTNTTTTNQGTGNSSSSFSNEQDTDVKSMTDTQTNWDQIVNNFSQTVNQQASNTTTTNSADPDVIANLKQLAQTAINNSTDASKTTGLISGILQTAGDAMTSIFGNQKSSGLYSGASAQVQANDTNARATADAASAVLGYQTNEQTLASDALGKLLTATATQNVNSLSTQTSTTQGTQETSYTGDVKSEADAQTHSTSNGAQSQASQTTTQSTGSSSASIVCTWMWRNGYLERADYRNSMIQFHKKGQYTRRGYLIFALPLVVELDRDRTSIASRTIMWVFKNRTDFVCGRKSLAGGLAVGLVILGTLFPGLYLIGKEQVLPRLLRLKELVNV